MNATEYEAWYHTPKGRWIGECEISLLLELVQPKKGDTLLDVGSGTGYFSRKFSDKELLVTGIDPDLSMVNFAKELGANIKYIEGVAEELPFNDNSFDYSAAITSLCFVDEPEKALAEMWRVSRNGVVLGLLNRDSLLFRYKHGKGGYIGARWDSRQDVKGWVGSLQPFPKKIIYRTAIFIPSGGVIARFIEHLLPGQLAIGGFLCIYLSKK